MFFCTSIALFGLWGSWDMCTKGLMGIFVLMLIMMIMVIMMIMNMKMAKTINYLYMLGDSAIRVGQAAVNSSRPSPSCSLILVSSSS